MKSSSKAQIGLIEMIMVMVVITVLIIIGMVFYSKFSTSSIEKEGEKISEEKASVITATIVQLPEIECTYLGSRASKTCADTIKLLALSAKDKEGNPDYVEHRRHYSDLLGSMVVTFEQLYPSTSGKECTPEIFQTNGYPAAPPAKMDCGNWTIYNNPKRGVSPTFRTMPIALYYPSNGMYAFGQLKAYLY